MRYLPNGKQMSEADAHTIHEIGIPSLVLMERAALQIVETMHKKNISTDSLVSVPESHPWRRICSSKALNRTGKACRCTVCRERSFFK